MRISRKKRPEKLLIPIFKVNERIIAPEVRVIDDEDKNIGVLKLSEAIAMAREQELDLVEINPKANPPVCKIVGFKHFKYQKEKEARKQKANAHESETKGIRLSVRIGDHDLQIRVEQATKFLDRGDKVKAEIILRGRENAKPGMAFDVLNEFQNQLGQKFELRVEQPPTKQGNKVTSILAKK